MPARSGGAHGPDLALIVAGAIFFVATLLPWYRVSFGQVSNSSSAWGSGGLGVLSGLFGIGALIVAGLSASSSKTLSAQSAGLLAFVLSAGAFFFALLRLAIRPPGSRAAEVLSRGLLHVNRGFGLLLAVGAAIVMTVAAYFMYRENAV